MAFDDEFPPLPSKKPFASRTKNPKPEVVAKLRESNSTKTTLTDLPTELLLQIVEYLPCLDLKEFQLSAIVSLSRTNRRLHTLVSNHLYAEFNSFFCTPYLFLRTVISSPQLAAKVHTLRFSYGIGVHEDRQTYIPSVSDCRAIKAGMKGLGVPNWKSWATNCNDAYIEQETLYAAILMNTPNVNSLDIDDGDVPYRLPKWLEVLGHMVQGTWPGKGHRFEHIHSIRLDIGELRLYQLTPLFRLSALRKLTVIGLVEIWTDAYMHGHRWPISERSCAVEDLSLLDCFSNHPPLVALLNTCRSVKRFRIDHRNERWYHRTGRSSMREDDAAYASGIPPSGVFQHSALLTALRPHRDTLESLSVNDDVRESAYAQSASQAIGDLSEFRKLEHLSVSLKALALFRGPKSLPGLVEILPPSLGFLELIMHWEEINWSGPDSLDYLMKNVRAYLPQLRVLKILNRASPAFRLRQWNDYKELLDGIGVELIVVENDFLDDGWSTSADMSEQLSSESDTDTDESD